MTAGVKRIERANLILGGGVHRARRRLWGARGMLGAGVGALLACADFVPLASAAAPRRGQWSRRAAPRPARSGWPGGRAASAR